MYHTPIMLKEAIHFLNVKPNGVYVDATFGGGGHSSAIMNMLNKDGKLIAFDQDADVKNMLFKDERFYFVNENFSYLENFLAFHGIQEVDGILADLGVSSHQFDEPLRGFSYRFDGPLDMRMDKRNTKTASLILENYNYEQLKTIFQNYGEVTNARNLANYIIDTRHNHDFTTIFSFMKWLKPMVVGNPIKFWAKLFQALRMEVNAEVDVLQALLKSLSKVLKNNGCVVFICFHSIEDRIVKHFFSESNSNATYDAVFGYKKNAYKQWEVLTKKPVMASLEEQKINPRSSSAKLRAVKFMKP